MDNLFFKIENEILSNEEIIFEKEKIKDEINKLILEKFKIKENKNFFFEDVVCDFFDYIDTPLIKTKKTRDSSLDGILKLKLDFLGDVDVGLQIKNKIIDSTDVDSFYSSLKLSELQIGTIICRDSRHLEKYDLNTKIKTILLSRGIELKEKLINDKIDINPVFIIKFEDIVDIASSQIRGVAKSVYKKW